MRQGFIFDLNKCVGCHACVVACQIENGEDQHQPWREISTFNSFQHPELPVSHYSLACNHCKDAPCLESCPALAYTKDENLNTIVFHADRCIGCTYCIWACPYDAPKYINLNGIIEKCTLCTNRLNEGLKPACTNLCPTGALDFGDFYPVDQSRIPGFTEKGISPGIKLIPLRSKKTPVRKEKLSKKEQALYQNLQFQIKSKISLKKEWVLLVFTLLTAILTALISRSVISGIMINKWIFLVSGILGMGLSAFHLGKKLKAWRSVLNLKTSWLSREILSYGLFILLSFIWLDTANLEMGYIAALLGFGACYAIDKVYQVTNKITRLNIHSASVFLSAMLFTAVLVNNYQLLYTIIILKFLLYAYRKIYFRIQRKSIHPIISSIRIIVGFLLPLILLQLDLNYNLYYIFSSILLGEIIDRIEFYLELDISTPKNQIRNDLASMIQSLPD
ncbi:MAG: 4Fe-4S binding protein [Bacteroidales bacterium]|nr:4Fe-4S binding protein [Bacteroidales bacterium]